MNARLLTCFLAFAVCACSQADAPAETTSVVASGASDDNSDNEYWGVEAGEPLPIVWQDLLPEGALDEYFRQQEEFYQRLEMRLQANASRLSDVTAGTEIEEGSDLDYMPQFGTFDTVDDIDGTLIRIPGYVVPFTFETDDRYTEFLFVPSQGACIHTPPPPPNQIVYVTLEEPIRVDRLWDPIWAIGELTSDRHINELGDAAYTMRLIDHEPYE